MHYLEVHQVLEMLIQVYPFHVEQIGQEGPMVHIGAAIASSLTWMHGRFPTRRKQGSRGSSRLCLQKLSKFTQKAWPFVSLVLCSSQFQG